MLTRNLGIEVSALSCALFHSRVDYGHGSVPCRIDSHCLCKHSSARWHSRYLNRRAHGGDYLMASIAERIRLARNDRGLSQTELSRLLGVNRATVGHWESGESFAPNLQHLHSLSLVLEVTID
ncbi:helix-turn-helix transcriptional regulator [Xanthomonas albilineans]